MTNQIDELAVPEVTYESFQNNETFKRPITEAFEEEGDNISINIVNKPTEVHEVIGNRSESLFDIDFSGITKLIPV